MAKRKEVKDNMPYRATRGQIATPATEEPPAVPAGVAPAAKREIASPAAPAEVPSPAIRRNPRRVGADLRPSAGKFEFEG